MEQQGFSIDANQAALSTAIDALVDGMLRHRQEKIALDKLPGCPSLDALAAMFGLSAFEQGLVLLCAAVELDSRAGALCAEASSRGDSSYPAFGYALSLLPQPHWSSLGPESPLRRWRIINPGLAPDLPLSMRPLNDVGPGPVGTKP